MKIDLGSMINEFYDKTREMTFILNEQPICKKIRKLMDFFDLKMGNRS